MSNGPLILGRLSGWLLRFPDYDSSFFSVLQSELAKGWWVSSDDRTPLGYC